VTARRGLSAIVVCFFAYLAYRALRDGSLNVLAHIHVVPAACAFVFLVAGNNILSGLRWWVLQGCRGTALEAIRRLSESVFFSVVLPTGSVGGDIYRGVNTRAAAPVVADRLIGASVTGVCAAAALPAFVGAPWWLSVATAICAGLGAYASWLLISRFHFGPAVLRRSVRELANVTAPVSRVGPAVLFTLGYVFSNAVFLMLLGSAVGTHLGLAAALIGSPLVLIAGALPSLHGLSFLQVALGAVLLHAGARHDQAAAAAAAQLIGTYLLAVAGGTLLMARRVQTKYPRPSTRTSSEAISL
jgi:hypothetical protein